MLEFISTQSSWGQGPIVFDKLETTVPWPIRGHAVMPPQIPGMFKPEEVAFVARPGVWMPWEGGENPVPGMRVKWKNASGDEGDCPANELSGWGWPYGYEGRWNVVAYMVVDPSPVSSDT